MYIPKLYRQEDQKEILEFIGKNNFGILTTFDGEKLVASHLLFEVVEDGESLILYGHMSRANPQWKTFGEQTALVIFQGPHTYISPRWYNHVNVPTWNYLVVHVYGIPRLVEGDDVTALLSRLVAKHEGNSGYQLEALPLDFVEREMKGLVAFSIRVTKLEAGYKLSQNRNDEDHRNIVLELERREDEASHAIAKEMKKQRSG